jgi:hypothetical protein
LVHNAINAFFFAGYSLAATALWHYHFYCTSTVQKSFSQRGCDNHKTLRVAFDLQLNASIFQCLLCTVLGKSLAHAFTPLLIPLLLFLYGRIESLLATSRIFWEGGKGFSIQQSTTYNLFMGRGGGSWLSILFVSSDLLTFFCAPSLSSHSASCSGLA